VVKDARFEPNDRVRIDFEGARWRPPRAGDVEEAIVDSVDVLTGIVIVQVLGLPGSEADAIGPVEPDRLTLVERPSGRVS
jgi:hypothetical protein